jgi:hypothetical protein
MGGNSSARESRAACQRSSDLLFALELDRAAAGKGELTVSPLLVWAAAFDGRLEPWRGAYKYYHHVGKRKLHYSEVRSAGDKIEKEHLQPQYC